MSSNERKTEHIWWYNHLRHTTVKKYDNNGKVRYFRFDDDNKLNYEFMLLKTWMDQFNTYNATYCEENKECNRKNQLHVRHTLDTLYQVRQ